MGSDAVKFIKEKIEGHDFSKVVKDLLEKYEDLQEKINISQKENGKVAKILTNAVVSQFFHPWEGANSPLCG